MTTAASAAPDAPSSYAVSFDAFDAALTSALDAIDGAAGSLFGDDTASSTAWDDETSKLAAAWRACALPNAQESMREIRARVDDAKARDVAAKRALKEKIVSAKNSKDGVVDALTEEIRRLQSERDDAMRDAMNVCDSPLATVEDPSAVLESIAAVRRELDAARVERDAAKARALNREDANVDATAAEAKMKAQIESALKGMESKKRAAERAADAAREGQANAERELRELRRRYDDAQTRLFELEDESETAMARLKIERDELMALGESIKAREDAMDAADERRRAEAMDASTADAHAALLEKLAVKERMVVQLATTIEEAEKNAVESQQRAAKELEAANQRLAALGEELAAAKDAASGLAEREEIARLKTRVKMLQELSGVSDAVDSAAQGATDADESTANLEALRSLREKNKKLAAEVVVATREKDEATAAATLARNAQEVAEKRYTDAAQMVSTLEMDLSQKLSSAIEVVGDANNADLLTILTAQRDRFKRRAGELEERSVRLEQERLAAEDAKQKLENDSIALVEKLTFVQNYYSKQAPSGQTTILRVDDAGIPVTSATSAFGDAMQSQSAKQQRYSCGGGISVNVEGERSAAIADGIRRRAARYGCFGGPAGAGGDGIPGGDAAGVISRYRKKYLAKLNPFAAFRDAASDDSASLLPLHDRIALGSGKMLMTSRTTRTLFSTYIILLHVYFFTRAFR
jgi:homeobox protein cut-like